MPWRLEIDPLSGIPHKQGVPQQGFDYDIDFMKILGSDSSASVTSSANFSAAAAAIGHLPNTRHMDLYGLMQLDQFLPSIENITHGSTGEYVELKASENAEQVNLTGLKLY